MGRVHADLGHLRDVEARSVGRDPAEDLQCEHRDGDQDHRQGHLRSHQRGSAGEAPSASECRVSGADRAAQVHPGGFHCRAHAEQQGAAHRHDQAEDQRPFIELHPRWLNGVAGVLDLPQDLDADPPDGETAQAAGERERHALGDQLPDQAGAACSHRQPQRDLAGTPGAPAGEQSGDVRAGHPQDHGGENRQEHHQPGIVTVRESRLQLGLDDQRLIPVGGRIGSLEVGADDFELRARLGDVTARS